MGAAIGPPGEALQYLEAPYHHCFAVVPAELKRCCSHSGNRHEGVAQGGSGQKVLNEDEQRFQDLYLLLPWAHLS